MGHSSAIQAAVYNALDTALSIPVYDKVPQAADSGDSTSFPYVSIGDDNLTEWDTYSEIGISASIVIHVWSRKKGRKETKDLQGSIYNALHHATLTVAGYDFVSCDFESSETMLDADGETIHGVSTFRIILDEA